MGKQPRRLSQREISVNTGLKTGLSKNEEFSSDYDYMGSIPGVKDVFDGNFFKDEKEKKNWQAELDAEALKAIEDEEQNNMIAQQEKAIKEAPKNSIEAEVQQVAPTLGVDYTSYKDKKAEYEKLNEKTFGWKQKYIFESNLKRDLINVDEKNDSWLTRQAKNIANIATSAINAPLSFIDAGVWQAFDSGFTPKEELKYNQLKKEIFSIEKPILEKQRKELQDKYAQVRAKYGIEEDANFMMDSDKVAIDNAYRTAIDEYDSAIDEGGIWNGLIQDKVGILSIPDNIKRTVLVNKLKNNEELTDVEKDMIEAYQIQDNALYSGLNSNSNYELGKSLRQSVEFVAEMALGQKAVRGILNPVTKGLEVGGTGMRIADATTTIGSAAFMPSTYNQGMQKYNESTQIVTDEEGNKHYLASDTQKFTEVNNIKNGLKELDSKINIMESKDALASEEETALNILKGKREYLQSNLNDLIDENGNLTKGEKTIGESLAYGLTQNIKENLAERYVGGIWDKYVPAIGNKLLNNKVGKAIAGSGVVRLANKASNKVGDALRRTDDVLFESNRFGRLSKSLYSHVGPAKMIHSLPAEMVEEIAVQLTPTLGEDYATQLNELTHSDFYTQVAASTLLMGGGFTALGAATHYKDMALNKEYRENYRNHTEKVKALKKQYSDIDNALDDNQLAQSIAMNTLGSIYQIRDYQGQIAELRDPQGTNPQGLTQEERNKQADILERNSFINMALQAIQTDTDKELKRTLGKLATNEGVSEETKKNALEGLNRLNTYKDILTKNRNLINRGKITDLEIRRDLLSSTLQQLNEERNSLRPEFNSLLDNYNKQREEAGNEVFDSFNVENALENDVEQSNQEFNNYVADFIDVNSNEKIANRFLELTKNIADLNFANNQLNTELKYETNPANQAEILEREKQKLKTTLTENVDKDNVANVKESLTKKELATPKVIAAVNEKVIDSTHKNIDSNKTPQPKVIPNTILDKEDKQAIGDSFDDAPANEKNTDVDNINKRREAELKSNKVTSLESRILNLKNTLEREIKANKSTQITNSTKDNIKITNGLLKSSIDKINAKYDAEIEKLKSKSVNAKDLFDDFDDEASQIELTPEEQASVDAMNQGNFAPINYDRNNSDQNKFVDNLAKGFSKIYSKHPQMDFDGLIASLRSSYSGRNVEQKFNLTRAAWEKAINSKLSDTEVTNVYNSNFADVSNVEEINSAFGGVTPQTEVVLADDIKKSDEAGQVSNTEYNPETNQEEQIEYAPHSKRMYAGIGLKLGGVLGLNYEETEDGKSTITNEVNETAKPFMDWRNFKPGTNIQFVFDIDYLLNSSNLLPVWENINAEYRNSRDEKPTKRLVSVRDRLLDIFKDDPNLNTWDKIEQALQDYKNNSVSTNPLFSNEEFLKIAPVGTVNNNYITDNKEDGTPADSVLMGGLNDFYWFNNANLALRINNKTDEVLLAERELRLQENRRINLEARRSILQNGKLEVTISENRDAQNNVRVLKTEEEKNQGYTNNFHSILSQFANNKEEFSKNATVAYLDASDNFVGSVNNSGDKVLAKIGGKTVKKENIINFKSYVENAKKKNFDNGRTVFIHKAGVNEQGEETYLVHDVINNHKTKQDTFKKTRDILDKLYFKLAIQDNDGAGQRSAKEVLQKEFKKQFGYEFTKGVKVSLENIYPKPHLENGKRSGLYRQDFNAESMTPGLFDIIPDLSQFETVEDVLESLKNGNTIPSVNKTDYMLGNLHTNLVFTPITKDGQTIYSINSQPIMMFDYQTQPSVQQQEVVKENVDRLSIMKTNLAEKIQTVENEEEKAELKKELKEVEKELSKNETIVENTVSEVQDITTEERDFNDNDKFDIIEELIGRAFSKIDISNTLTVQDVYGLVDQEFNSIVQELKDKGQEREAQYMEDNRAEILGTTVYEDSIREYINSLLDISDIEEFLDQTGENVKEQGQSSYEVDVTKSLSFKVKLMLSGIKDTRLGKGFAGFDAMMSLSDSLDSLHQVLSEANNNSIEDIKKVIEEKIKKNPGELSFYNQILNRLNLLEKTNPEILSEIMYNLYQPKVQMRFVMWRADKNGYMTLENYDANVKNPLFIKRNAWSENIKRSGLLDLYEGNLYKVNENAYNTVEELHTRIFEKYNEDKNIANVNRNDLESYLKFFGISLNAKTLDNVYEQKSQNDLDVGTKLLDGKNSILNVLFENLKTAKEVENKKLSFDAPVDNKTEVRKLNPLTYRNSQINDLIHADNFVEFIPMNTMYIAGKSINMYQQPNAITNKVKSLTESLRTYINNLNNEDIPDANKLSGAMADFKNTPITSNSYLLGLLERNPERAIKYLDSFLISLESLKESGTKSRDDMGMTSLSDKDAFVTLMGMFASSEGDFTDRLFDSKYDKKVKLRKGVINFPTVSDSSQLPFLKTVLIELSKENVNLDNSELDESILSIMKDQLLISDLIRISDYITKVGDKGSNVDGYDAGAIWITGLPSLNTVQVDYSYESKGETINTKRPLISVFRDFIKSNPENNNIDSINDFVNKYSTEINANINANVNHEVNKMISPDLKTGQFVDFELMNKDFLKLNDGKEEGYFATKPARLIAYDYVVNNLIQQKEIQTIFAGDLAQYFKNKMQTGLKHGLPKVKFEDVQSFHYNSIEQKARIKEIMNGKEVENLSEEESQLLINEFPEFAYIDELITPGINHEEAYQKLLPIASAKVSLMFKDVQNNLSKRLKGQISPGSQMTDTKNAPDYIQVMVSDVDSASETLEDMIQRNYPEKLEELAPKVREFKALDNIYSRDNVQEKRYKELNKELNKAIPKISAYLKTASTDAQEYTSWKENLNQLRNQGRITPSEYARLEAKLIAQTEDLNTGNFIKEENKLTDEELKMAIMQPSKPLYSGMVHQDINNTGHTMQRYVYVKSSSFPLVPELTQMFPKLNNLRKTVDKLEDKEKTTVRVSYQSANKVGAVRNAVNVSELYNEDANLDNILTSSIRLSRDNFYIQQDKPFKSDKNAKSGKPDRVTRATQFEKIILGDGINKLGYEFPSDMFDQTLLSDLGIDIKDGKIDGPALKNIYNSLYEREQKILSDKLFNELGIDTYSDIREGKPEIMENLVRLLNRRISNKQDKKTLELLYKVNSNGIKTMTKEELVASGLTPIKALFKIPLFMTPNSRKFESVLNSVINKNNINLGMPGFSFPVASQEGFDYKGYTEDYYKELREKGLIVSPDFDPTVGLKSTRDDNGKLKYAQVFLANKYKTYNNKTGKYEYLDLTQYVDENNTINLEKLPKDLLSMFSFRIPTSSHQSGTIIEVAGFLPHNLGDLMIVPKDHTVQIGEDYDIDVRYAYQYNYIKDANGNIKKLEYSDIQKPDQTMKAIKAEYTTASNNLWNKYYRNIHNVDVNAPLAGEFVTEVKNPYLDSNRNTIEEIVRLEEALDNYELDKLLNAMFKDLYEIDDVSKDFLRSKIDELEAQLIPRNTVAEKKKELQAEYRQMKDFAKESYKDTKSEYRQAWNKYNNAYNQKGDEQKVIENNLIAMYKSVFSSQNVEVQNLITKVLSTDFSEESASEIDSRLSSQEEFFNIYAPSVQRRVMKLGADGKMGIGVHSNAVTMNSLLQQLDNPLQFIAYFDDKEMVNKPYNITLGKNTFNGTLGKITDGKRRLSEYLMESQNSATDNQKLEIMGRRNENAETISVFSLLQMTAMEDDGVMVNGKDMSYASLFISQPVILEYVDIIKKYKSSTNKSYGNPETMTEEDLMKKYIELVPDSNWQLDENGKPMKGAWDYKSRMEIAKKLNSKFLFDQLRPLGNIQDLDMASQLYILESFVRLKKPAKELVELQSFINIENGGLGVSYFDVINLKDKITKIDNLNITTTNRINVPIRENTKSLFQEMFGEIRHTEADDRETILGLEADGYIFINSTSVSGVDYNTYVKPSNHYSHKIMNSIGLGYNLWNSLFPYDNKYIQQQIDTVINATGLNPESKKALELKYDIISNMKDYSYTDSKVLFEGNVEKAQRDLFFDDKENGRESLGSYLIRLKNNQEFKYIFNQPFFKDLQIEVNENTYPTIIKYNTGDISPLNNLKIYNRLERLINSDKALPAKLNGKLMTEAELMKDLLKYSLLADQGNGAIGFRQLLPLSLFEKYNVDSMLRNRNNIDNQEITNFVYNGPNSAAESFLGSSTDEKGIISNVKGLPVENIRKFVYQLNAYVKSETGENKAFSMNKDGDILFNMYNGNISQSNFVRQYLQHNPDKIAYPFTYSDNPKSKFQDILKQNNISLEAFEQGKMTTFSMADYDKPFIVIKDNTGASQLFERYDSVELDSAKIDSISYYKRIPVLGVFGFNEYQTNKNVGHSKVSKNNFNEWRNPKINAQKTKDYLNNTNLDEIVEMFRDDYNSPYSALINTFKEFIPDLSNVQVRIVADLAGKAVYHNENGQTYITINEKFLNRNTTTAKDVQDAVVEELLHHITVSTMNDYISFTGVGPNGVEYSIKKDAQGKDVVVPAPLLTLISVYNSAVKHYAGKHGIENLRNKIQDHVGNIKGNQNSSVITTTGVEEDAYRTMNIHEFIAGIFIKDSDFANEMSQTPYLQSGKSILAKFADTLARFFNRLLPGAKKDSISANVASNLYDFLVEHHSTPNNKLVNIPKPVLPETASLANSVQRLIDDVNEEIIDTVTNELPIIDTQDIINAEGQKGAAQYDRKNNVIKVNRPLLRQKFEEKAWTKMRELVETIHGDGQSIIGNITRANKKTSYSITDIQNNKISRMGYRVTLSNQPNVILYITKPIYEGVQTKEWTLDNVNTNMTYPINISKPTLTDIIDYLNIDLPKRIKNNPDIMKNIGIDLNTNSSSIKSKAENLSENQFETYEQFEAFVIEHERQHSIYSRQDFNKDYPDKKTKGDYETEINNRAIMFLENSGVLNNTTSFEDLFSPNNVSLSNPITNVDLNC